MRGVFWQDVDEPKRIRNDLVCSVIRSADIASLLLPSVQERKTDSQSQSSTLAGQVTIVCFGGAVVGIDEEATAPPKAYCRGEWSEELGNSWQLRVFEMMQSPSMDHDVLGQPI